MQIKRRDFMAVTAGACVLPHVASGRNITTIAAKPSEMQLAPANYPPTKIWGFDGTTPGPQIRVAQGEMVERRVLNELPEPTAVHWHGIRIENAMDGVPGFTQSAIEPGDTFDYSFRVRDAGTFWYHSHNRSWEQVARGLYGPLIVDETNPPDVDQDLTLMIDDWRMTDTASIADNFGAMHDHSHAGRLGNYVTVNAQPESKLPVKTNQRLRLRLINAANARIFQLGFKGLSGRIVALDGMPLIAPLPLDLITLVPAQRADVIVDVTAKEDEEAVMFMTERGESYALTDFIISGAASVSARDAISPLPLNDMPSIASLDDAMRVPVVMDGGAMRGLSEATYKGEKMGMRELISEGQMWALNGIAGFSDQPLFRADRNQLVLMAFENRTAFPHGMHLHGHHFYELDAAGKPGAFRDTTLVNPGETKEVVFVADNPGKWLVHCHMLGHQAAGMKTWVEVA